MNKPLKVAIIGCGQISFSHLTELAFITEAQVVGVCDTIEALAEDTAERYSVPCWYTDYKRMIEEQKPDVVHITIPPAYQKSVALDAIDRNCSIYVEKPFCLNTDETEEVIEAAKDKKVLVCAGFSQIFDNACLRAKKFIDSGRLGDVVHIDSYYGNDIGGNFAKLFLKNEKHWLHRLPGKLFQNIVSHPLAQVAPYMGSSLDNVICYSYDRSKNGVFDDELRVILSSGSVTANIMFTSSVKPVIQYVKIYGTKSILEVDLTNHIFSVTDQTSLPGPFARIRNAFRGGNNFMKEGFINIGGFLSGQDRYFSGMGNLFRRFYEAIGRGDLAPPIPYEQLLIVSKVIDKISDHCGKNK